jgi:hypothetical protein
MEKKYAKIKNIKLFFVDLKTGLYFFLNKKVINLPSLD